MGHHSLILITPRQILDVLLDQQVGLNIHDDTNISALIFLCPLLSTSLLPGNIALRSVRLVCNSTGILVVFDESSGSTAI